MSYFVLLLPVAIDIFTGLMTVLSNRGKRVPSGFPVLTLLLYGFILAKVTGSFFGWLFSFLLASGVHVMIVFAWPFLDARWAKDHAG
ncbi:MAG: hypothetical protein N838_14535 [Thiohalocapsa sp. PB-PSB1]|jgi:hypothetical protein|nr:MAG: hypothetical protein N838_14535 [Thiohalocapsa sp. PB-PSB1]HCS93020.1 hypothetical protein [Chromatiaceae bacterium]